MNNTNTLPAEVLIQRRELLNAVNAASKAYATACRAIADGMGLIGKTDAVDAERRAWEAAERDLATFYAEYPMSVYKKAYAAESRSYRGRAS